MSDNESNVDDGGVSVDPREVFMAFKRRKWIILIVTVVVTGAIVAGTMRQPKIYAARAQIMLEPNLPKLLGNDMAVDRLTAQARAVRVFNNTQFKTMTSRTVIRDVADRLQLATNQDFLATYGLNPKADPEKLAKSIEGVLLSHIKVEPEAGTRIVNLLVEDQDPLRAVKIANTLGDAYIEHTLRKRLDKTHEASRWLDKRVDEFAGKLEAAEKGLYEFKREHMLVDVSIEDRRNMTGTSLQTLVQKLVETRTNLIGLRAKRMVMHQQIAKTDGIPDVIDSPVIMELRSALVSLDKKKADLSTRYGDKHPIRVGLDKQLKTIQTQLDAEVKRLVGALDNKILAQETTEKGLNEELVKEKRDAMAVNSLSLEYTKLSRNFGTTKVIYQQLLQRQTETDLSGRMDKFNFVDWFQRAEPQMAPVRPSVPRNSIVGLAVGLLLGFLIALAGVLLDNTVHTQAEVEELLKLPFLGAIPRIEDESRLRAAAKKEDITYDRTRDLYIVHNPKSAVAECARSVRTNLLFMGADRSLKKLLLTSAGTGEGKTTTSISLAVTMAQAGNRVVLLDTDLRKPRLHRAFGVSGEVGITSVLVETATLDEAIKKTEVVGLDVLPCGPLPPNPADLLHSDRFRNLLDRLAEKYDRVLLDSPPVGVVTDAAILSQHVDGCLLVIQAKSTTKESARRARRRLVDVGANIVGVVLNDLNIDESSGGQQYYYYRYGYGHDSDEEANAKA